MTPGDGHREIGRRRPPVNVTIDLRGAFAGSPASMRALADAVGKLARDQHLGRDDDGDPPALVPA